MHPQADLITAVTSFRGSHIPSPASRCRRTGWTRDEHTTRQQAAGAERDRSILACDSYGPPQVELYHGSPEPNPTHKAKGRWDTTRTHHHTTNVGAERDGGPKFVIQR